MFTDDADFATSGVSGQWDRQTSQSQAYDGTLSVGHVTSGNSLPTSLTILFTGKRFFASPLVFQRVKRRVGNHST